MILDIFKEFLPNETFTSFYRFGNGHINSTYLVSDSNRNKYIFQKINHHVFNDVDALMNNIYITTNHLKSKNIETLQMIKARNGKFYVIDHGNYYRVYKYIKNSFSYEKPDGVETVKYAATAFGKFHNYLADLDASKLAYTIPDFHNSPKRYKHLLNIIDKDEYDRVKNAKQEIDLINKYSEYLSLITDGIDNGTVKLHITHNDPKINNALFDENSHKYRCVVDLDTVMPGSILYDFGDALRSLFTGDLEDSKDYKSVVGNLDIYKNYLSAYYNETSNFLTEKEKELFPYAPFILALELGIRFLDDYLSGDKYFGIKYEEHNLDRARTQINLAVSIIEKIENYKNITKIIVGD